MLEAQNLFKAKFFHTPTYVVRAPGRVELLGNHTDYNQGVVLSFALDKAVYIASSPRIDGRVELASSAYPETEKFFISELKKNPAAPWTDHVKGVLEELRKHRVYFTGFNAAVYGNLPIGAGLSSSAALAVATALTVREMRPHSLTETASTVPPRRDRRGRLRALKPAERLATAKLCQASENKFVGVNSGLLDPLSSLSGKKFHGMLIDCQRESVDPVPMIGEICFVLCDSGVKHTLTAGQYNEIREQCEGAARVMGVKSLRLVDNKMLAANKAKLTERQYACAYHVTREIQRVFYGEKALQEDDFALFGELMFQSHESSRDFLKNSTPELDLLVEIAREHPGTLGARLTGGGFGGATINLVKRHKVELFMEFMSLHYEKKTGHKMKPMLCQVADGAR